MARWCRGYWSSQGRVEKGWNWVAECNIQRPSQSAPPVASPPRHIGTCTTAAHRQPLAAGGLEAVIMEVAIKHAPACRLVRDCAHQQRTVTQSKDTPCRRSIYATAPAARRRDRDCREPIEAG